MRLMLPLALVGVPQARLWVTNRVVIAWLSRVWSVVGLILLDRHRTRPLFRLQWRSIHVADQAKGILVLEEALLIRLPLVNA